MKEFKITDLKTESFKKKLPLVLSLGILPFILFAGDVSKKNRQVEIQAMPLSVGTDKKGTVFHNSQTPSRSSNKIRFKLKGLSNNAKSRTIVKRLQDRKQRLQRVKSRHRDRLILKSIKNVRGKSSDVHAKGKKRFSEKLVRTYKARLKSGQNVDAVIEILDKDPDIEWAEPVYIAIPQIIPNDPNYLNPSADCGYNGQVGYIQSVKLDQAWDVSTGSSDVVVAVLDWAGNYYHEDLSANKWINTDEIDGNNIDDDGNGYIDDIWGWDFSKDRAVIPESGDLDGDDFDSWHSTWVADPVNWSTYQHGTHVGGIIGAKGNNALGISGANWNVKLMLLHGLGSVEGLYYACDNGADIVNMSFATGATTAFKEAVEYCYEKGVFLVAASGNYESTRRSYPAAFDHVFAVGSAKSSGELSSFSHYGTWLDLVSPGEFICSSYIQGYGIESGTSMATPVVSGIASLLKSVYPQLKANELARHLYVSAKDSKSINPSTYLGMGAGYLQAELNLDPANIATKMEVTGLAYENQNSSSDEFFYKGDTIRIRPTVRNFNFSGMVEDVTLTLSLPDSVGLTATDTTIHLDHVGPNRRVTSWEDTFQVKVQNSLTEFDYDQEFTISITDGKGHTYSSKNFKVRLNPFLSNTSWLSGSGYNFYNQVKLAENTVDSRVHAVFSSDDSQRQLHHRVREADGSWGDIQLIPNPYSGKQHYHEILAGADGKLHLVYVLYSASDPSNNGIYYTWYDPSSDSWDNGVRIGGNDNSSGYNSQYSRVKILFDNNGYLNVFRSAWLDSNNGALYWIKHNGSNWENPVPVFNLDSIYDWQSKQFAAFLDDNNNLMIILDYKGGTLAEGLYYTRYTGSWNNPPILISNDIDFSAASDSNKKIHLISWKSDVDYENLYYKKFENNSWLSAPTLPNPPANLNYNVNRMKIIINHLNKPEIFFADGYSTFEGLYRSFLTTSPDAWSDYSYIHRVDHKFYLVSDFEDASVLYTSSGELIYAYPYSTQFFSSTSAPIMAVSSDQSKRNLLPERPIVSLTPDQSNNTVRAEISNFNQFAYSFLTLGIAPNEDDLGTTWENSTRFLSGYYQDKASYAPIDFELNARWIDGQSYYATARAIGSNGYLSSMGSSAGSCAIEDFETNAIVVGPGDEATLSWHTVNADTLSITPDIGNVTANGTVKVYPNETTIYTLTATGNSGQPITSEITINVATDLVSDPVGIDPPDPQTDEYFGSKIVMGEDIMLVGSPFRDNADIDGFNSGAVYIYQKNDTDEWIFKQQLEAKDGHAYDHFGSSIAIDGNTIVIGSTGSDIDSVARSGAAYVFEYDLSLDKWKQMAKLTAPINQENQGFGASVDIDNDRIVVSSGRGGTNGVKHSGSVHIFTKPQVGVWGDTNTSLQISDVSDLSENDRFGSDVSLDGDTLVVGAVYSGPANAGKAYVFEYNSGVWNKTAELKASDYAADDWDYFGNRVLIQNDIIVIASFRDNQGTGSVFIFEKGSDWTDAAVSKLTPPRAENNNFGIDFDFNGTTLIVGQSNYSATDGYAYIFKKKMGVWEQTNELSPPTGINWSDNFGSGIAIGPKGIAVGARFKDGSSENSGAIYTYDWDLP